MAIEETRIYELTDEQTTLTDTDLGVLDKSGYTTAKKYSMLNLWNYIKTKADNFYQTVLVSGTSIKTINSTSVLGSGNIAIKEGLSYYGEATAGNQKDYVATIGGVTAYEEGKVYLIKIKNENLIYPITLNINSIGAKLLKGYGTGGDVLLNADYLVADVVYPIFYDSVNETFFINQALLGILKQDQLVSATNIKTINGNSILGSGDLVVGGTNTNIATNNLTFTSNSTTDFAGYKATFDNAELKIISDGNTSGDIPLEVTQTNGTDSIFKIFGNKQIEIKSESYNIESASNVQHTLTGYNVFYNLVTGGTNASVSADAFGTLNIMTNGEIRQKVRTGLSDVEVSYLGASQLVLAYEDTGVGTANLLIGFKKANGEKFKASIPMTNIP